MSVVLVFICLATPFVVYHAYGRETELPYLTSQLSTESDLSLQNYQPLFAMNYIDCYGDIEISHSLHENIYVQIKPWTYSGVGGQVPPKGFFLFMKGEFTQSTMVPAVHLSLQKF